MKAIVTIFCPNCMRERKYLCQVVSQRGTAVYAYECITCQHEFTSTTVITCEPESKQLELFPEEEDDDEPHINYKDGDRY